MPTLSKVPPTAKLAHSIQHTTAMLDCGRTTVYELLKTRQLEAVKLGKRTLVLDSSIRSLLASLPRAGMQDAA